MYKICLCIGLIMLSNEGLAQLLLNIPYTFFADSRYCTSDPIPFCVNQLIEQTVLNRVVATFHPNKKNFQESDSPKVIHFFDTQNTYFFWVQKSSLYQHYGTQKVLFALGNIFKIETGPEVTKPLGNRLELTSSYKKVRLHKKGLSYTLSFKY